MIIRTSVCVCVCIQVQRGFQQFFSHITMVCGCNRELNAHFYSAASLKYHVPDTWHDTTPSHTILTLGRPVLVLPQRGAASTIFYDFGMSRPGIEPVTFHFPRADTLPTDQWGPYIRTSKENEMLKKRVPCMIHMYFVSSLLKHGSCIVLAISCKKALIT